MIQCFNIFIASCVFIWVSLLVSIVISLNSRHSFAPYIHTHTAFNKVYARKTWCYLILSGIFTRRAQPASQSLSFWQCNVCFWQTSTTSVIFIDLNVLWGFALFFVRPICDIKTTCVMLYDIIFSTFNISGISAVNSHTHTMAYTSTHEQLKQQQQ